MSDVTRYNLGELPHTLAPTMVEAPDGEWVDHSDYAKLEAKIASAEAKLARVLELSQEKGWYLQAMHDEAKKLSSLVDAAARLAEHAVVINPAIVNDFFMATYNCWKQSEWWREDLQKITEVPDA